MILWCLFWFDTTFDLLKDRDFSSINKPVSLGILPFNLLLSFKLMSNKKCISLNLIPGRHKNWLKLARQKARNSNENLWCGSQFIQQLTYLKQ